MLQTSDPDRADDTPAARSPRIARWIFWLLSVALLPLMVIASFDFGMTWDELSRHLNGIAVLQYLRGEITAFEAYNERGVIYPGLFDVICAWLEQTFTADRYVIRHIVNAVFGWIGVFYCGRLTGRLFGPWAGVLALVLLASAPRYFADSMNNPKDLPFAAMTAVVLYYFSTISPRWPYISVGTGVKIAVALALALSTRPAALLYLGYLALLLAGLALYGRTFVLGQTVVIDREVNWRALANPAVRVALIAAAMLYFGTYFWPWAHEAPFTRPFEALSSATDYDWNGLVVFRGEERPAKELPASYVPTWLAISTPPVVLAGLLLSFLAGGGRAAMLQRLAVLAAGALPVALIVLRKATVYDGIRHVLFVYPPMVAVAAAGWTGVVSRVRAYPFLRAGVLALLAVGLVDILSFNVRSYPNQIAYFNTFVGGPRGAFGRYELDYWGNCLLQAAVWSAKTAEAARMPILLWGAPGHIVRANLERFPQLDFIGNSRAHVRLRLGRGPVSQITEWANSPEAVHHVKTADGAVLCTVLRGPRWDQVHQRLQAAGARLPS